MFFSTFVCAHNKKDITLHRNKEAALCGCGMKIKDNNLKIKYLW